RPDLSSPVHREIESRIPKPSTTRGDSQTTITRCIRAKKDLGVPVWQREHHFHTGALETGHTDHGVAARIQDVAGGPQRSEPAGVPQLARRRVDELNHLTGGAQTRIQARQWDVQLLQSPTE